MTYKVPSPSSVRRAFIPAFIWLLLIGLESTPLMSAAHTGVWLSHLLGWILGPWSLKYVPFANHVMRKTGHFTGYGMMSYLSYRGWHELALLRRVRHSAVSFASRANQEALAALRSLWCFRAAVLATLTAMAVASLDEWHQTFMPSRTGALHDVILDTAGAILAQSIILSFSRPPRLPVSEIESRDQQPELVR